MPIVTLRDLYIAELQDLYDAEQQLLEALPAMAAKTTSSSLRRAFEDHFEQTRLQMERLELLFRQLDIRAIGHGCEGMRGLLAEARRRMSEAERGDVLDAALIGAAQRIEHYEMAAYGCARTYAETLGDAAAARLLQQTLDEEGAADHQFTRMAQQGINQAAGDDVIGDARERSRLRYVEARDLPDFRYREFRLLNRTGDDLGVLDGSIVDGRSGRPIYFVIDSGGWLAGRRYVIPIGQLDADEAARALRTTLDRQAIRRYPEFNSAAFLAMDDEEVRRYEHRLLTVVAPERARAGQSHPSAYEELPEYRPPTWLMTGVWMTEATGFAAVPPRAIGDLTEERKQRRAGGNAPGATPSKTRDEDPKNELMTARGKRDDER
jgi:ferritin-like metal-binding protein YciE